MTAPGQDPDVTELDSGRNWDGYLTTGNAQAAARRLRKLLDGHRFTYVNVTEGHRHWCPEVRTGQHLEHAGVTHNVSGHGHAVYVHHSGSIGCLYAQVPDQETAQARNTAAAAASSQAIPGEWLHDKHLVYLRIRGDRAEIEHHAPGGNRLYWVYATEGGTGDRGAAGGR